ncbi:L-amino acid N-acetyltransferase AaaT [Paenibacillus solanacearum]|uniref:L-amino acid N-acetyltransferase AaaT n=1 Tax=Paenibacillus solanacearum TaxID=2048548 RepID=A0A916JY77_9BACL|nr:GNAT family protein [Paenibacillus solanacearum]CAG7615208.1 L-amino acid N-acetyltransferase AaaT [Paenibacillus solanacearum]
MLIRVLTPEDAVKYRSLRLRSLQEHPDAFLATYDMEKDQPLDVTKQRLQAAGDRFTLGCFPHPNELAGIVTFVRESHPKLRHKGHIYAMYVAPKYRGNRAGSALLRELIARAGQFEGLEQINLTVMSDNAAAKRLYASLGFEVYGTERRALRLNGRYWDEDLMALTLP